MVSKPSVSTEVLPQLEERAAWDTRHLRMKYLILEFSVVTMESGEIKKKKSLLWEKKEQKGYLEQVKNRNVKKNSVFSLIRVSR